jgi:hypothetical protein
MSSKYQRWYDSIVEQAKGRRLDVYYERHHVTPRALGGSDDSDNLVDLTYREHFLVHWLLTKMCDGQARRAMVYALHCMTMSLTGRVVSAWQFEIAKRAVKDEVRKSAAVRLARWIARRDEARISASLEVERAKIAAGQLDPTKGSDRNQLRRMATLLIDSKPERVRNRPKVGKSVFGKLKRGPVRGKVDMLPARKHKSRRRAAITRAIDLLP